MALINKQRLQDKVTTSPKSVNVNTTNELAVFQRYRIVGPIFEGSTLDTNFWTETTANGGAVAQANNILALTTSTATNGSAACKSNRKARYVAGVGQMYRGHIKLGDTGTAGNIRRWGAFGDDTYGVYFQLDGTTFSVVANKSGTETKVNSGSFAGDNGASVALDTNWHVYEIIYGSSVISFFIDDVLIHRMSSNASGLLNSMVLPANVTNAKTSGATDISISVRTMSIFRLGHYLVNPVQARVSGAVTTQILKRGAGKLVRVIVGSKGTLCTIYDSVGAASGTMSVLETSSVSASFEFGVEFENGLTITTTGAGTDLTIIYE
jgi:hypothetical protein